MLKHITFNLFLIVTAYIQVVIAQLNFHYYRHLELKGLVCCNY